MWLTLFLFAMVAVGIGYYFVYKKDTAPDPWLGPKAMMAEGKALIAEGEALILKGDESGLVKKRQGEWLVQRARNLLPDELEK